MGELKCKKVYVDCEGVERKVFGKANLCGSLRARNVR
jgi:hypothetical protein